MGIASLRLGLSSPNVATNGALDPKRAICMGISLYRHARSDNRDYRIGWCRRGRVGLSHIGRFPRAAGESGLVSMLLLDDAKGEPTETSLFSLLVSTL